MRQLRVGFKMTTLTTTTTPFATTGIRLRQRSPASPVVVETRSSFCRGQEIKIGFRRRPSRTPPRRLRTLCRRGRGDGEPEAASDSASGLSQSQLQGAEAGGDDLGYLLKLGLGTFSGAAVIKYGSAVFPEITRPNLTQALLMISLPVLAAILLLFINQVRRPTD